MLLRQDELHSRAEKVALCAFGDIINELHLDPDGIELNIVDELDEPGHMGHYNAKMIREGILGYGKLIGTEDEVITLYPVNMVYNSTSNTVDRFITKFIRRVPAIFDAYIICTLAHEIRHVEQGRTGKIEVLDFFLPPELCYAETDARMFANEYINAKRIQGLKLERRIVKFILFGLSATSSVATWLLLNSIF